MEEDCTAMTYVPERIPVHLKRHHFVERGAYSDCKNCALGSFLKQQYPDAQVHVETNYAFIDEHRYWIPNNSSRALPKHHAIRYSGGPRLEETGLVGLPMRFKLVLDKAKELESALADIQESARVNP